MDKKQAVPANQEGLYDLGQWMGRKQAFGMMAGRAAAADVECLRRIRDDKLYRAKAVSWSGFCKEHIGITRGYVDRLIKQLEEFGPNYFHLSQLVRISPEAYRLIAPAVGDSGVAFGGEVLTFAVENAPRIAAAVTALRAGVESKRPPQEIAAVGKRLDACVAELNRIGEGELTDEKREELAGIVGGALLDLKLLALSLA
jgi:hypothetical protein